MKNKNDKEILASLKYKTRQFNEYEVSTRKMLQEGTIEEESYFTLLDIRLQELNIGNFILLDDFSNKIIYDLPEHSGTLYLDFHLFDHQFVEETVIDLDCRMNFDDDEEEEDEEFVTLDFSKKEYRLIDEYKPVEERKIGTPINFIPKTKIKR